ncbi:MAG: toxin-antitoxin system TumE family protein [Anaerolineae bacterium]
MSLVDTERLRTIAEIEYTDIVADVLIHNLNTLRVILRDGSFVDIWYSLKLVDRYSYHWERRAIDGTIFRHDNAPHQRWEQMGSFPKHFHNGSEEKVEASSISSDPETALREFLDFVRSKLQ